MARFNNMAFVTIAGKRQVRVNVSGKPMFFFDVPANAKYVAIDCSGSVWAFECKPTHNKKNQVWDSVFGIIHKIGVVGFINNSKDAYISVSSAEKEFDAFATGGFATGGFVKGDQLTVNADEVKAMIAKGGAFKITPSMIEVVLHSGETITLWSLTTSADKDSGQCKIEDIPVAAKVMAVKDGYENWVDFYYVSNRIEIHSDSITLLNKQNGFMAEVSFKRGTMVKWEK